MKLILLRVNLILLLFVCDNSLPNNVNVKFKKFISVTTQAFAFVRKTQNFID